MSTLNQTHDPALRSWVASANDPASDFPIQNLPHGVFRRKGETTYRGGVAIGDQILDLAAALDAGLFEPSLARTARLAAASELNAFMAADPATWSALRARLSELLRADGGEGEKARAQADRLLVPMSEVEMTAPTRIGAFTDFMTSTYHIETVRPGRPERKGPDCFRHLPIAYNSRASSVTADGRPVERPNCQWRNDAGVVVFAPTERLDFELEFGFFIGKGNVLGQPIPLSQAEDHIFGYCLLNDWSARDTQFWENVLGPFLGKSFRTSISPWVVTREAMAPFRMQNFVRKDGDPEPLPYLDDPQDQESGGLDVSLTAALRTPAMRKAGQDAAVITRTHLMYSYFSLAQMLTHHASNGCNLQTGDLMGSGTVSGPQMEAAACLLERTGGVEPLVLPGGEERRWLEDGDEVVFRGRAERPGFVSIGFGECAGQIAPAVPWPGSTRR